MKIFIFITLVAAFAMANAVFVGRPHHRTNHLLGAKECTWGPSYWCQNITTSAHCRATKHCIDLVWIHKQLPPDTSSVCQTCKDMVTQARDNLLSNGTQELIKEVFEGSCALMHIKPVVKACDEVVDEFVPELIDTLASQMNPQAVCSVAGLCNSEKVHKWIAEAELRGEIEPRTEIVKGDTCKGCHSVVQLMEKKFQQMSRDDVLQSFLHVCGKLGSLSDACSNIVITYFTDIYEHIQNNFNPTDVCLMSGECSAQFHTHDIEITIPSQSGYVKPDSKDDLPCDLCEQLVGHLRDLLVANTTESEFKMVLEGLCKQTKSFKTECLNIVDQYYELIYNFLVTELKPKEMCSIINICPKSDFMLAPMSPLIPIETADKVKETQEKLPETPLVHINLQNGNTNVKVLTPETAQLPIELLVPGHAQNNFFSKETCMFCQYFLHFVQEQITDPKTEEQIKSVIDKACAKLPNSINETCVTFVDQYEPALVAILSQEIDPSQVCPMIRACPSEDAQDNVEVFMSKPNDSPKCPMCLYAVSKLESMVKDKKSKQTIISSLDKLCKRLPASMSPECEDFVQTYTNELVDMLMADFTPNEVCVYLHLCNDTSKPSLSPKKPEFIIDFNAEFPKEGDILTNIIPDNTINGKPVEDSKPQCALCEFVMKEVDDQLKNNKTEEDIKKAIEKVCKIMPKSLKSECKDFIEQNSDTIFALLGAALEPSEICAMLNFCDKKTFDLMRGEILECAICEGAVEAMKKILDNPRADHTIVHVMEKTCHAMPLKYREKCQNLVENFGTEILDNISYYSQDGTKICQMLGKCTQLIGSNLCTRGPTYWCQSKEIAEKCKAIEHCETKVWIKRAKRSVPLLGQNKCTWGPAYFCDNMDNARECGAVEYCQKKYWNRS